MEVVTVGRLGGSTAAGRDARAAPGPGCRCGSRSSRRSSACRRLRHRSGEAASAGAALLAGKALGMGLTLDQLDPVDGGDRARPRRPSRSTAACGRRSTTSPTSVLAATASLPGRRPTRASDRVRVDLAYGRHGTSVEVPDGADVDPPASTRRRWPTRRRPSRDALRRPAGRAAAAPTLVGAPGGWRSSSPTSPGPCRTAPCCRRCSTELARGGRARRPGRRCCAPPGPTARPPRRRWRSWSGPSIVARYRVVDHDADERRRTCAVGEVDGVAGAAAARVRRGRRAHHHRVRRAALLRRLQRRPEGGVPGPGRHRDDPRGPPPAPDRRRPGHLRHPARATRCTTSSAPPTALAPPHLSLDVAINRARRVTAVFAGPLPDGARRRLRARAVPPRVREVDAPFDLVVSTNGGHPLDRNLYQAVKGMAAAERVVRDGGDRSSWPRPARTACPPAAPSPACWPRPARPADLVGAAAGPELDRWQAQVLGPGAGPGRGPPAQRRAGRRRHRGRRSSCRRPTSTARWRRARPRSGRAARVAVLPEGPLTVATVAVTGEGTHRP